MHRWSPRRGTGIAVGCACTWLLACGQGHAGAAVGLSDLTGPWLLLVDDHAVASRVDVTRTYHPFQKYAGNPVIVADKPWEGANIYIYGTVLPNESGPGYRMWYHSLNFDLPSADRVNANYATSVDGITWTKPELGIISFNGSKANNIFIDPGNCPSVMHTPWDAGIQRPYKLMRGGPWSVFSGAYSMDGIHWTEDSLARCPAASDHCTFAWDPHRQKYMGFPKVFATVNGVSRRSTGVWATSNFDDWPSGTNLILAPDSWDDRWVPSGAAPHTQFYGMCGFAYESMYIGFLWVFRVTGQISGADDGPIFVEIVTSHDGTHWRRQEGDRPPILPLGPSGAWDDGMVFTAIQPLVEGDTLRLYYGGFNGTHAEESAWQAAIGMATLRKDGFASLDAGATPGTITTKRINGASGPLRVNCSVATGGSFNVEVLNASGAVVPGYSAADCDAIQGDHVDQVVTWGAQTSLPTTVNPMRLRFIMQDASLYSFNAGDAAQLWAEAAPPTLTMLYDFEGDTGQTAHDKSVADGAQNPTFQGDVNISTDPAFAGFGSHAAAFGYGTSTSNMLTVPGTSNLGVNFTLAAMVNSATGEYARIFSSPSAVWGTTVASPLALDFDPGGTVIPRLRLTCKGMQILSSSTSMGSGPYHHVAVTYNDGRVYLYLDGMSVGNGYVSRGDPVLLPGDLRLGGDASSSSDARFIGYMDDIVVVGRTLSSAEITLLAQGGAAAFFGVARAPCDFDGDGDVDLDDFAAFEACYSGPSIPPACAGTAGAQPSATPLAWLDLQQAAATTSVVSINFLENWDSYAAGYTDPAYVARWPAVLGTARYRINSACPSSPPNNLRAGSGDSCAISHDLTPDLQAVLAGAVEVDGTDAAPLSLAYNACLQGSLQYADVIVELSKGEVHAPGTNSTVVLPVLAFGMAAAIHAPSAQPWFFDGQNWQATSVLDTTKDPNVLTMQVRGNTVRLSGGAGSVVQPRAYRGGFDRITIRSQLNSVIGRLLDDIKLTGGQVIGPCINPPVVNSITPTTARSDQRISLQLDGSGFPVGLTQVKLVRQGQPDMVASQVSVAADGQSLTCVLALDLYAPQAGAWNVVVMTPSCADVVASGAFTVTPSTPYVAADLDHDGDVDQSDFGILQRCFSGEDVPADANCGN
ncbi:MAG: hypothetical protein QUV05_06505 [Phycisphaerae bacterium]|nr:hypothetical protein [Phycisphaerae bacterium]